MTVHLPDVNALSALIDPSHVHHERAHRWFTDAKSDGWLSCPTTENGVVRIISNPRYSNTQPVGVVLTSLDSLRTVGDHSFVPDSISLLGNGIDRDHLISASQVTDSYLLALAVEHRARLATFDRRIAPASVVSGADALFVIP